MKSFDEIYQIVEESSHETAFNREECEAVYNLLKDLEAPAPRNLVEIGVEYGRSTTVFAEICKLRPHWQFTAIDGWVQENGKEAKQHVLDQMIKHNWHFDLWNKLSLEAAKIYDKYIDVVHIDGDHTYEAVLADCKAWLPKVKKQGYALFDDYGHDSLPGVFQAVSEYTEGTFDSKGVAIWHYIGRYGNKLGIFKKEYGHT